MSQVPLSVRDGGSLKDGQRELQAPEAGSLQFVTPHHSSLGPGSCESWILEEEQVSSPGPETPAYVQTAPPASSPQPTGPLKLNVLTAPTTQPGVCPHTGAPTVCASRTRDECEQRWTRPGPADSLAGDSTHVLHAEEPRRHGASRAQTGELTAYGEKAVAGQRPVSGRD